MRLSCTAPTHSSTPGPDRSGKGMAACWSAVSGPVTPTSEGVGRADQGSCCILSFHARYARRWRQRSGSGARRSRDPDRRDRSAFPRVGRSQSGNNFVEGVSNMKKTETPREPSAMSRSTAIAYTIGLPLSLLGLIFLPAGTIGWRPGWIFLAVLILGFGASALVLARVNPMIYRARSRFQPGTKSWDKGCLRSSCRRGWRSYVWIGFSAGTAVRHGHSATASVVRSGGHGSPWHGNRRLTITP